jgi:integrase
MQAKDMQRKAFKGSVQIKSSNDRLQLVFSYGGKRRYLSLGMRDTTLNRRVAEMTASQIELDMLSGNFDDSLDKYRREPLASPEEITPILTPIAEPVLTPHQIWEQHLQSLGSQGNDQTLPCGFGTVV